MPKTYRIAGVQMIVDSELDINLPKILEGIERAADDNADFVLFPEMALTGYHGKFNQARRDAALKAIRDACRQHKIAALVGAGDHQSDGTYVQVCVISDRSEIIGTYEKMVPTSGDRKWCKPGKELRTFEHKGLHFGCLICNDLWVTPGCGPYPDPRLAYQLGEKGVDVIFHAINSGSSARHIPYHESNVSLRAAESRIYIITVNAARHGEPVNCASGIMKPDGTWQLAADRLGEQFFISNIEVER